MGKAILAGFGATVVLSILMLLKGMMGFMPELNVIQMLTSMSNEMAGTPAAPWVGWVLHFLIGTVVWGAAYYLLVSRLPGSGAVSGMVFGVIAWLLMMIIVMPLAGAGLFAMSLGIMAPVMTLILHLIYGAVLGAAYKPAV